MTLRPTLAALFAFAGSSLGHAMAQCTPQWLSGPGVAGASAIVWDVTRWDPDGTGPLAPRVALGGDFATAGNVAANRIAAYDPATGGWSALGEGMNGVVNAVAALPNGDLVAGGGFTTAGGVAAFGLARWNGAAWTQLGGNATSNGGAASVSALVTMPNGDLVAAGNFNAIGGVPLSRIARWNGATWSAMGAPVVTAISKLAALPNGDLVASGQFTIGGGAAVAAVARWDGAAWSYLGGVANGFVSPLAVLPNGDLVAGGNFSTIGGVAASRIARWNGTTWSPIGGGVPPAPNAISVSAVAVLPSGELVAAGGFQVVNGFSNPVVALWNGSSWAPLGGVFANGSPAALQVLPNGELLAAGAFTAVGAIDAANLARWNGSAWAPLATGFNGLIRTATALPNGNVVAGGVFTATPDGPAARIASWNGSTWSSLGGGVDNTVSAIAAMPNGDLVVGGAFLNAGGVAVNRIARWNGATWSPLGTGCDASVFALAVMPNGDLVAGGVFTTAGGVVANGIARWNGTSWSPLGAGIASSSFPGVYALAVMPNGDLVVGGIFTSAGGVAANRIARWNGASWSPLGSGLGGFASPQLAAWCLAVLSDGSIVAAGGFSNAGGVSASNIARWNGATWAPMGQGLGGSVYALAPLPNGEVVACGSFTLTGGTTVNRIARWTGSAWSALGDGLTGQYTNLTTGALALRPNGEVVVGGGFSVAGNQGTAYFARYATPCAATVAPSGLACASSGGANTLAATTMPWTGSIYRTRGTGLPSLAIVAVVNGFSTASVPLAAVLPPAPAACSLLVSPDVVDALVTTTGAVDAQLTLPNNPSLAGTVVHQQFVALEVDALGSIVQNTSTNRLTATVGSF
jgi:hypothetical protein